MDFAQPEHELLVLLSSKTITSQERPHFESPSYEEIRWNELFTMAYNHGVFPLVFTNWRNCISTGLTEGEIEQWGSIHKGIKTHNMVLTMELIAILQRLQLANVTAIPLKGPILTHLIYGDVGLRMFSDLDILVRQDQIPQALDVLLEKGYRYHETSGNPQTNIAPRKHHYSLENKNGFRVELHRTLEPPYYLTREDSDAFWKDLKTTSQFGIPITLARDEETLLFLCRHGSRHLWRNLKWLADVAQFLRRSEALDWDYISARVESTHTKRMVFLGLYLANQLFASPLPEQITQTITKDTKLKNISTEILNAIFDPQANDNTQYDERYIALRVKLIQLREGRLQRIRYIYGDLLRPNSEDEAMVKLPPHLSFLYYIMRPFRLLAAYGSKFFRNVRK